MSDKINDGGAAFPFVCHDVSKTQVFFVGMSLRDYFAAKAMAALCSSEQNMVAIALNKGAPQSIASDAYVMADAMIAEREKN